MAHNRWIDRYILFVEKYKCFPFPPKRKSSLYECIFTGEPGWVHQLLFEEAVCEALHHLHCSLGKLPFLTNKSSLFTYHVITIFSNKPHKDFIAWPIFSLWARFSKEGEWQSSKRLPRRNSIIWIVLYFYRFQSILYFVPQEISQLSWLD